MGILAIEVLGIWSLVALLAGLALGVAFRKSARVQKDEFLACLFATLESMQASR
jgi:hypothetical protein